MNIHPSHHDSVQPTASLSRLGDFVCLGFVCLTLIAFGFSTQAIAHEGHAPLPAKGVEVDVLRGSVLLTQPARDALGVETAEVSLDSGEDRILAYAKLVSPWQQHALVASQISGRITRLHILPGDEVEAGQALADIDSPELQNLQLELINAQNAFLLSSQLVEHYQSVSNLVVGSKLQEAEATHRENINVLENARIKLTNLGLSTESIERLKTGGQSQVVTSLQIRSPISGTANHSDLNIGKVVEPGEHLFEVVDLSTVWGKIEILERDLQRVDVGQEVEVTLPAYPGEIFHGQIKVKENYLVPETHLGTAWIDLPNPSGQPIRLLPGMFGQAQVIIAAPEKMLTVPMAAVARDGAERFVLVQEEATDKASQFIKRNVVVLRQSAGKIQFRADQVFPGDRVVTTGAHELFNFFVQGVLRLSKEASENIGLRIEEVETKTVGVGISIDGLVELPSSARDSISSQLPGTLEKIHIARGQFVRAGDVICELASLEFLDFQLQLITAQIDIANLQTTLKRWEPIRGSATISKRQIWETESLLRSKQNLSDNLQRKLLAIGMSPGQLQALATERTFLRSLPLRTTIDGFVVHFDKVLGQTVAAGDTIVEVHDPSRVLVRGFVSERELSQARIDQPARIRFVAAPDFVGEASVIRSSREIDINNRTLSIWLELSETAPLMMQHNMLARINLVSGQSEPSLAISRESVVSESTNQFVFVQSDDGKFERRLIETGRSDDRFVEVTSGLKSGEKVAAWGASDLQSAYASLR